MFESTIPKVASTELCFFDAWTHKKRTQFPQISILRATKKDFLLPLYRLFKKDPYHGLL